MSSSPPSEPRPSRAAITDPAPEHVVRVLVDNHARFLAFLERRVGSRDVAEDLLQEAFVRGLARARSLRDQGSAVAWFYRLLRNALTDHYRRRGAERRALERVAAEPEATEPPPDEQLMRTVCACVASLLDTLKPEYAAVLRRVELDGLPVRAFAAEAGITANNAAVRVHRAREALRWQLQRCCRTCADHGCVDCGCEG
jgi:RNA polymerase sigma-70 factor (ECF subfamily)